MADVEFALFLVELLRISVERNHEIREDFEDREEIEQRGSGRGGDFAELLETLPTAVLALFGCVSVIAGKWGSRRIVESGWDPEYWWFGIRIPFGS